jgi:hypothetical protein
LDQHRPNLHWRVLTELVGRSSDSHAVRRSQGGASAAEPVASLIADLHPDGQWTRADPPWGRYSGWVWSLIAAVQLGADPSDPRLHAAMDRLLGEVAGRGGFSTGAGRPESPLLSARLIQAAACLGFSRHLRVQEALAWFEEDTDAWSVSVDHEWAIATALLGGLTDGRLKGHPLFRRTVEVFRQGLQRGAGPSIRFGHPNLARTDLSEVVWSLARAGVPWSAEFRDPIRRLQRTQDRQGRWLLRHAIPASLPVKPGSTEVPGQPSRWITLRAVVAMNAYAVDAALPRLFPEKPAER